MNLTRGQLMHWTPMTLNDIVILEVILHDKPVGTLTHVGGDRTVFAFNEEYIEKGRPPVLGLNFRDHFGNPITNFRSYQTRLPPFFSNLLPEGQLREYLAKPAGVNPQREFFLIAVLGSDLPGAVKVRPKDREIWLDEFSDEGSHSHRDDIFRFSLAGVQLKFSVIENDRGGLTIPAKGIGGTWIVKLPFRAFEGLPENEYSMMQLARLIGVDVPHNYLINVDEIANLPDGIGKQHGLAFAIERFDRLGDGQSVHIEDFAQVFGVFPADKYRKGNYRSIARVIAAEGGNDDIAEFIRRLTFSVLIGNADMHLKNWSLMYPDQRTAALAPAYDFVSTIPYIPDKSACLNFSRTKLFAKFTREELTHLAAKADLPQKLVLNAARETVELFHQFWQREKRNLPLTEKVVDAIDSHIKILPIAKI